jgi:hypothetical protein
MSLESLFSAPSDSRLERLIFKARGGWRQTIGQLAHTAHAPEDATIVPGQESPAESTLQETLEEQLPAEAIDYGKLYLARRMDDPNREQFVSREYTDQQWTGEVEKVKGINLQLSSTEKSE